MKVLANFGVKKVFPNTVKISGKVNSRLGKKLSVVDAPMLLYLIQRENDFKKFITDSWAKNRYVMPEQKTTYEIINTLEEKKIILPERAWETPRFHSNILTDEAYKDIVDKVAASNLLTKPQKEIYINKLANSNYKTYKPTVFKGSDIPSEEALMNSDMATDSGLDLIDTTLPDDLKDFLDKNPLEISEGFFDSVKDVVVEGVEGIGNAFDSIKDCLEKLGDVIS